MSDRSHTLVSFDLCPFVQRSSITLQHKGVEHDITYIDLYDKPDWFLEISPFGKVPVLVVEEDGEKTALFESAVINRYLDEQTAAEGHGSMQPEDPLERAVHNAWIEVGSALAMAGYGLSVVTDEISLHEKLKETKKLLGRFEGAFGEGPYFAGEELCLVDTSLAPPLQRLMWLDEIWPGLGIFDGAPKVKEWTKRLMALDAVKDSTVPDIRERFVKYLKGGGSASRDEEPSLFGVRVG